MESQIIQSATDIIQPVLEGAMILAGNYVKACSRKTITAQDVQYAMKYCTRNFVGQRMGTLFPDESDSDDDSDDDSVEEVDEEEEPFVRYTGDDKFMNEVNESVDTWEAWIPTSPIEIMLKDSIDKTY
jgi:hypothetical protein